MQYISPQKVNTAMRASLNSALKNKKDLNKELKLWRDKLKLEPIGGNRSGIRLKILKLQDLKHHAEQAEKQAREYIEKIANEQGFTTMKTVKNPAKKKTAKRRSAVKQYKDFHHRNDVKIHSENIDFGNELIYLGKAVAIIYESDKFDGRPRLYKHDLKKHGNVLAKPEGRNGFTDLIIFNNLKLKIKKEGLTG